MNETHDPALRSWVESANDESADFPIQNLPFGVFRAAGVSAPFRGGVAIGDSILDLGAARAQGVFTGLALEAAALSSQASLNALMAAGSRPLGALRLALSRALRTQAPQQAALRAALVPMCAAEMALPAQIGDYTDFYISIHHATAVGRLFRPDQPLMPNYRWLPVGYHGRSSSVGVSPQAFPRPVGQRLPPGANAPVLGPSQRLDYELELGAFIGRGNTLGSRIAIDAAESHIFGLCLLNDWSARDLQAWEYQPLGPFLGKNFATTISPWVVTLEALEPYREPWTRTDDEPAPLAYLDSAGVRADGAYDIQLEVLLQTARMRATGEPPASLARTSFRHAYWTLSHMLAHHTINGCNLRTADLLGTGTQSGPDPAQAGSLLELSRAGEAPVSLPDGERRTFLEDGDSVIVRGFCERHGAARIGFGEARGTVLPAHF
jgi:fumarylacetoacetase